MAADGFKIGMEEMESMLIHGITKQGEVMLRLNINLAYVYSGLSCKRSWFH